MIRFFALVLLLGLTVRPAPAQHAETLAFDLGGALPLTDSFEGLWTVRPGAMGRAALPFYGGTAHLGLHAFPNRSGAPERPEFLAVHAQGGWGYALALPAGLRLTPGVAVGALHMRFDDEDRFIGALQNETELTAGAFLRLDAPVAGPVRAFATAEAVRVFTAERIDLGFVHAGLSASVARPAWVERLLR